VPGLGKTYLVKVISRVLNLTFGRVQCTPDLIEFEYEGQKASHRQARNVFRPWEDDVEFVGYWRSADLVKTDNDDLRVSLYRRPGSALFVLGNVGDSDANVRVVPDWGKLGISEKGLALVDPEPGESIPPERGAFVVPVKRHDVRLVLAGDLSGYRVDAELPGKDLPRPKTILEELSDPLRGPKLDPAWEVDTHEGASGVGFVDGRLYVQGHHYGYAHVRRQLGVDNVSVQCLVMRKGTGCSDFWAGGLSLWWENGDYVRITPGWRKGKFIYEATGRGRVDGSEISKAPAPRWFPYFANWVKVRLTPETVECYGSSDGKTWTKDLEVKRGKVFAGPPAHVLLGHGGSGKEPYLKNVAAQHFRADHGNAVTFFSDLVIGKD